MAFRIWLCVAALCGLTSVAAAGYGAHTLNGITTFSTVVKIYETGQLFHVLHSIVLFGIAILFAATEGWRGPLAHWALQISAVAFLLGIVLFSGGIYAGVLSGAQAGVPVVPAGGGLFLLGWVALAISAFGFRRNPS